MLTTMKLTPEHADQIARLETKIYPPRLRTGPEDIKENLKIFEEENQNFSAGIKDGRKLVGYITAWLAESLVEGQKEAVVYVDDMAILPTYKNHLYQLMGAFVKRIFENKYEKLAIEGMTRRKAFKLLEKHKGLLEKLSYRFANHHEFFDEDVFEDLVWIRLVPIYEK